MTLDDAAQFPRTHTERLKEAHPWLRDDQITSLLAYQAVEFLEKYSHVSNQTQLLENFVVIMTQSEPDLVKDRFAPW